MATAVTASAAQAAAKAAFGNDVAGLYHFLNPVTVPAATDLPLFALPEPTEFSDSILSGGLQEYFSTKTFAYATMATAVTASAAQVESVFPLAIIERKSRHYKICGLGLGLGLGVWVRVRPLRTSATGCGARSAMWLLEATAQLARCYPALQLYFSYSGVPLRSVSCSLTLWFAVTPMAGGAAAGWAPASRHYIFIVFHSGVP